MSYGGFAPTVTALMAGEVDSATVPVPDTIEHHKAGKLKILGVSATERHFMAPDVPTFRSRASTSSSARGAASSVRRAFRPTACAFLETNMIAALKDPEFQAKAKQAGFIVQPGRRQGDAATRWKSDDAALYPILLEAGLVKARQK